MFLAKYARSQNKLDDAMGYARHLHDRCPAEREEAGALMREITRDAQRL